MLNVLSRGAFARLVFGASAVALLAPPAKAQTYHDTGGTIVPGVVVVDPTDNSGPLFSASNPGKISGTFSATLSGFTPGGAYAAPLAVSTTSARVALPAGTTVVVYNTGSATAYVILGGSSATATASDDVIPAGGWMAFTVGANAYLAAITASGTTSLNVSGGSGLPTGAGGGGSGGSGGTVAQGTAAAASGAWPEYLTLGGSAVGATNGLPVAPATGASWAVTGTVTANLGALNGAATAANQTAVQGTAGAPAGTVLSVQGVSGGTPAAATATGATDAAPATQAITAADAASTPTTVANGQVFVTGTPTANSAATFALAAGYATLRVEVTGTWVGTLAVEMSPDGGTTWVAQGVHQTGTTYTTNNFTGNFLGESNAGGFTNVRVRATAWTSGTATVKIILSVNPNSVYLANSVKFSDSTTPTVMNAIKPASTAAAATDPALVVALSPNSPLPAGSNGIGTAGAASSPVTTNPTSTLTLPSTTTAYSAGQLIANSATAGSVTVPSFVIANAAGGALAPRLRLSTNDATSTAWGAATIQVDLWSAAPTWTNGDRGTWSPATGTASHLGAYACTMSAEYGDGAYAECAPAIGNAALLKLASGTSVYWSLKATSASGVTGASKVFTLTAELLN